MTSRGLAAGTVISGKYRLISHLGGGGMGDVYKAEHELAGRQVAIKLLRSELAGSPDVTRRFFQEAQAVNRIRHPNIVDVLDADISPQGPYVVMECLEGASVAYALHKLGKLELEGALAIVLPTLAALEAAHEQGIVHRDLKPENVFIAATQSGEVRVKLLDFGIAKVHASPAHTSTGVIFGTPDYLSPEQARGDGDVDGRSDLFAVGTVLYELLTGRRPWEAPNPVATAYRIVHAETPKLADAGAVVPELVQRVLEIALAKDRNDRYSSAAAFADALAPVAPDGPTRREALRALHDAVVGHQPTLPAARRPLGSLSFEPSLPIPLKETALPSETGWKALEPKKEPTPVVPTLVSNEYRPGSVPPRAPSQPEVRVTPTSASSPSRALRSDTLPPVSRAPSPGRGFVLRPLPAVVQGRCHVRGTLPRACLQWIERSQGKTKRDAVLARLDPVLALAYKSDAFNALVWYDIAQLHVFVEEATHIALRDDPTSWRTLARENFIDLAPILRPTASRAGDPLGLLKRFPAALARLIDFGTIRLDELAQNRVRLHLTSFQAGSTALRFMTLGMLDGTLAGTPGLQLRIASGESSFLPELEVEVHWRDGAR